MIGIQQSPIRHISDYYQQTLLYRISRIGNTWFSIIPYSIWANYSPWRFLPLFNEISIASNTLSPTLSSLFMRLVETEIKKELHDFPWIWVCYVDDIFAALEIINSNIYDFMSLLNIRFPSIIFTLETSNKKLLSPFRVVWKKSMNNKIILLILLSKQKNRIPMTIYRCCKNNFFSIQFTFGIENWKQIPFPDVLVLRHLINKLKLNIYNPNFPNPSRQLNMVILNILIHRLCVSHCTQRGLEKNFLEMKFAKLRLYLSLYSLYKRF